MWVMIKCSYVNQLFWSNNAEVFNLKKIDVYWKVHFFASETVCSVEIEVYNVIMWCPSPRWSRVQTFTLPLNIDDTFCAASQSSKDRL